MACGDSGLGMAAVPDQQIPFSSLLGSTMKHTGYLLRSRLSRLSQSRPNRRLRQSWARALFALAAVCMAQEPPPSNVIHVEISGLHDDKGQVMCALFSSAAGFPKDYAKASARAKSEISEGRALCEFAGVSAGTHAVAFFHDENSNGKLDTKFMGI